VRNVKLYVADDINWEDDGFVILVAKREPGCAPDFTVDMEDGEITNILISKRFVETSLQINIK